MNLIEQDPAARPAASHDERSLDANVGNEHLAGVSSPNQSGRQSAPFLGLLHRSRHDIAEHGMEMMERSAALQVGATEVAGLAGAQTAANVSAQEKSGEHSAVDADREVRGGAASSGSDQPAAKHPRRGAPLRLVAEVLENVAESGWSGIRKDADHGAARSPSSPAQGLRDPHTPVQSPDPLASQPHLDGLSQDLLGALSRRYLIADDKYFFRDRQQILAFEDIGKRIATVHDDPDVARSMVDLAQAKGWSSIKVKGSEAFKREAWLAASLRGIEVRGFRPKENDRARLAELAAEIGKSRSNGIEKVEAASRVPEAPQDRNDPTGHRTTSRAEQAAPALGERHREELEMLKTLLRDRGDSEKAVELTATLASEQLLAHRYYVGKLLDHGAAPYKHDPHEQPSYFVVLDTPRGEKTVWGVDLARAVADAQVERGTDLVLTHAGKTGVAVPKRGRTEDDVIRGTKRWEAATRNEWEITTVDSMRDLAAERAVAAKREPGAPLRAGPAAATERGPDAAKDSQRAPAPADRGHDRSVR